MRKVEDGMLILENLTKSKPDPFEMIDKHKVPSLEHSKVAFEALAHFHGAFWRLLNDPDFDSADGMTKQDAVVAYTENMPVFMLKNMVMKTFESVQQLMKNRNEPQELINRVERWAKTKAMNSVKLMLCDAGKDPSKVKTICHGDFWSNNMMFSHTSDGKPKSVKLLDFQMMALSHPTRDLCYFLYVNTDKAFRDENLEELLKTYFDTYSKYLSPILNFTFEEFKSEFNARRDVGFVSGLLVMPNVISPNQRKMDTMADFNAMNRERKEDIASPDKEDDHPMIKEIRRRTLDIVHEFAEIGAF